MFEVTGRWNDHQGASGRTEKKVLVRQTRGDKKMKAVRKALRELDKSDWFRPGKGEPPGMNELPSHGNAILPNRSSNVVDQIFRFADVTVDVGRRKITCGGEAVKVTPAEYNLLLFFVQNVDRPLTRDVILNAAWGYDFCPNTRTVDVHVARLRHKLEPNPATPRHFVTIHRVGYRFLL